MLNTYIDQKIPLTCVDVWWRNKYWNV